MLAGAARDWEPIPTALDELWCPLVEFVGGAAEGRVCLFLEGGAKPSRRTFEGERCYLLTFRSVEFVGGYGESLYCFFVRPSHADETEPGGTIVRARNSEILDRVSEIRRGGYAHFAVRTGGMHLEIVADPDFELEHVGTREEAVLLATRKSRPRTVNYEAGEPDAEAALKAILRRAAGRE